MSAAPRPKFSRNPAARAAFIAKREDIKTRLEKGEFMREIFEQLELAGSYTQFTRNVARYLPEARPGVVTTASAKRESAAPATAAAPDEPRPTDQPSGEPGPRSAARPGPDRPKYDPSKINRNENY